MRPHRPSKSYQATSSLSISFTLHVEHVSFQHIFSVLVLVALPSAYLFDCRSCSMGMIPISPKSDENRPLRNEFAMLPPCSLHAATAPCLPPCNPLCLRLQPITLQDRHMPWSFLAPPSPLLACSLSVPLKYALPNKPH